MKRNALYINTFEKKVSFSNLQHLKHNWWGYNTDFNKNDDTNSWHDRELTLRVPFNIKGSQRHLQISCRMTLYENKNNTVLKMNCNFSKPIFISLMLAASNALLFFAITKSINITFFFALPILVVMIGVFYFKVNKTCNQFVRQVLKQPRNHNFDKSQPVQ